MMIVIFNFWAISLCTFIDYIGSHFLGAYLICVISSAFLFSLLSRRR